MTEDNKNEIVFFCKDCNEIVETNRVGKKYVYTCKKCGTKNVAFGTRKSIDNFFRLDDKMVQEPQIKGDKSHRGN